MAKKKAPPGIGKFRKLTRLLVQVPKAEVEAIEAARASASGVRKSRESQIHLCPVK